MNTTPARHLMTLAALSLGLLISPHSTQAAPAAYTVTDLGVPAGGSFSSVAGINAKGQAALAAFPGLNVPGHVYLSDHGALSDIGALEGGSTYPEALNDSGQIVGWNVTASANHPFLYSGGQFYDLYPQGGQAFGLNNAGQVVGTCSVPGGTGAFLYSGGVLTGLSALPGSAMGAGTTWAHGINDAGQIVGTSTTPSGDTHAVLWQNGQVTDLATLGGTYSRAFAVNASGMVVGESSTSPAAGTTPSGPNHAFLWQSGAMTDLGTLPGGTASSAAAVNSAGQIVGYATTTAYPPGPYGMPHAVLWSHSQIDDLNSDIPAGSGWVLQHARGINANGQIVGDGTLNGQNQPFLLTPTAPQVSSLTPSGVTAGSPGLTLSVMGTGFVSGTAVAWNNTPLVTTYVSASQLAATVPAALLASPGTASVTADSPGGAPSNAVPFTITPATLLYSPFISPNPVGGGSPTRGYISLKAAAPAGGLLITFKSDSPLATVPASITVPMGQSYTAFDIATQSILPSLTPVTVHISATDAGGTVSASLQIVPYGFTSLTISPTAVFAGDPAGATVSISAPAPAGGLTAALSSNNPAVTVPPTVIIPAGATSATFPFQTTAISQEVSPFITASYGGVALGNSFSLIPRPTVSALSPSSATAGSPDLPVTVTGTNFISGATQIYWNGGPLPTTFVSGTQLTATAPAALLATPGTASVTVGDYRGPSRSDALPFTVRPVPTPVTQINAGGGVAAPFTADSRYSGGSAYRTGAVIDTSGVSAPAPQAVYQSERYGNFTYTIPKLTPGTSYTVRLHFAEIYWDAAGKRLFNVSINGNRVLSRYDIFAAAGGKNKAVVPSFAATADKAGRVTVTFSTVTDNAKVSGIEVLTAG